MYLEILESQPSHVFKVIRTEIFRGSTKQIGATIPLNHILCESLKMIIVFELSHMCRVLSQPVQINEPPSADWRANTINEITSCIITIACKQAWEYYTRGFYIPYSAPEKLETFFRRLFLYMGLYYFKPSSSSLFAELGNIAFKKILLILLLKREHSFCGVCYNNKKHPSPAKW